MDASDLIMISVDDHVVEPPWTAAATVMVQGAACCFEAQAELLAGALDAMTEWIPAA